MFKLRTLALVLFGVLLCAGVFVGGAVVALRLWRPYHERREVLRQTATVLSAVRDLARLEAAEYHLERVIDLRDQHLLLGGLVESEDALLLVAAGDVVAGVDLGRLRAADVQVGPRPGVVTVILPPPELFHVRLDESRTYVHSRRTDLLARRDEALETRARQQAQVLFREAALRSGILDRARASTERVIGSLLRSLGATEITLRFAASPPS